MSARRGPGPAPSRSLLYLLVFTAGFTVMLVEITAPRLLGPYFGTSAHVWTSVIGVILVALSIGYYVGGRVADRRPCPGLLALVVMWGCAVTALTPVVAPWFGRWVLPPGLGLGQAYDLLRFGSLVTALCVLLPPALLLAVVGPFTIRCLAARDQVGRSAGTIYAISTVGSILGTFLPTFVLIPRLGSRPTVLAATALLGLVAFTVYVVHRRRFAPGLPALLVVVVAGVVVARTPIRGEESGEQLIAEGESPYQYVRLSRSSSGGVEHLRLQVNEPVSDYHSLWVPGRTLTGSYYDHFSLLPYLLPDAGDRDRRLSVLILGLAGGAISRQYHAFFPDRLEAVDGVEVDPVMIDLARRHFALDAEHHPRLAIHVLDGRLFLRTSGSRYDIVIVDAYAHQIYLPPHMATVSFFEETKQVLEPGGVMALNASAYDPSVGLLPRLVNTVARAYGQAFVAKTDQLNYILFAFKDRPDPWPPRGQRADRMPEPLRPLWTTLTAPGRVVRYRDDPSAPVFTDDDCPVEILASRDLARTAARYACPRAR